MSMSKFARYMLLTVILIMAAACAKISSPTGGLRDRIPPVVVKSLPMNGTANFRDLTISILFDEYVVLDNINEKFMVSPPVKTKPKVYIKGKRVNIEFAEKLKDSTTYTLYFQDAIKDLNEGNILDNYQFVFSTGRVIDSLSVTGNVYSSYDLEVPEKTLALMYRNPADSAVIKNLPDYISRVNADGYFRINNIRPGKYRLYALKDDDNSKNYNRMEEEFAFMDSIIIVTPEKNYIPAVKDTSRLTKTIKKVPAPSSASAAARVPAPVQVSLKGEYQMSLFLAQKKDHYLTKSTRDLKYKLTYTLSLPPGSMNFEFSIPGTGKDKYFIEESRRKDTLRVLLTDTSLYSRPQISTIVKYPFTDTLGVLKYKEDTIPMRFVIPRAPRVARTRKTSLLLQTNISSGSLKPGQSIVFKSETPLQEPDTNRIHIYEIVETNKRRIPYALEKDSTNSGEYILKARLLQAKKYTLIADSASFRDLFNERSDSLGYKFSVRDPEQYSNLKLRISNCQANCIIQLLNQTEKIIEQVKINKDGIVEFPLLESGFYRLRAIYDLNGDGQWTTGDFKTGKQPEPVSYYRDELEIKAGWEITQDWDIRRKDFKEQKLRGKTKTR